LDDRVTLFIFITIVGMSWAYFIYLPTTDSFIIFGSFLHVISKITTKHPTLELAGGSNPE
jgi:hypothetical protein